MLAIACAVGLVGAAEPSRACMWDGNEDLKVARRLLSEGRWGAAARHAMASKWGDRTLPITRVSQIPFDLQRVAALAIVRGDGKATVFAEQDYPLAHRRGVDLAWAQLVLTYRVAMGFRRPTDLVDLAEALAADPFGRARARAILRDLDARDLMPTQRGRTLLAELDREA